MKLLTYLLFILLLPLTVAGSPPEDTLVTRYRSFDFFHFRGLDPLPRSIPDYPYVDVATAGKKILWLDAHLSGEEVKKIEFRYQEGTRWSNFEYQDILFQMRALEVYKKHRIYEYFFGKELADEQWSLHSWSVLSPGAEKRIKFVEDNSQNVPGNEPTMRLTGDLPDVPVALTDTAGRHYVSFEETYSLDAQGCIHKLYLMNSTMPWLTRHNEKASDDLGCISPLPLDERNYFFWWRMFGTSIFNQ